MRHLVRSAALIANYFDTLAPNQAQLATRVQQAVLKACPSMEQSIRWGNLLFGYRGIYLLSLVLHKGQAHLQIFSHSPLLDTLVPQDGASKGRRFLKLRYGHEVDAALIAQIVQVLVDNLPNVSPQRGGHYHNYSDN